MSGTFTITITIIAILFVAAIIFITVLIGVICWRKKRQSKEGMLIVNPNFGHSESDYDLESKTLSMKRGTDEQQHQEHGGVDEEKL